VIKWSVPIQKNTHAFGQPEKNPGHRIIFFFYSEAMHPPAMPRTARLLIFFDRLCPSANLRGLSSEGNVCGLPPPVVRSHKVIGLSEASFRSAIFRTANLQLLVFLPSRFREIYRSILRMRRPPPPLHRMPRVFDLFPSARQHLLPTTPHHSCID